MLMSSVTLPSQPSFAARPKILILDTRDIRAVEEALNNDRFAEVLMNPGSGTVAVHIKNGHNAVIVRRVRESLNNAGITEQPEG